MPPVILLALFNHNQSYGTRHFNDVDLSDDNVGKIFGLSKF